MGHPNPADPLVSAEEYSMPCAEALLASTLALMTGYVQACCDDHRDAMVRKIVANLQFLAEQPSLTPHFRTLVQSLQQRWMDQISVGPAALEVTQAQRVLWHVAPEILQ